MIISKKSLLICFNIFEGISKSKLIKRLFGTCLLLIIGFIFLLFFWNIRALDDFTLSITEKFNCIKTFVLEKYIKCLLQIVRSDNSNIKSQKNRLLDLDPINYPEKTIKDVESTMKYTYPQKINSHGILSNFENGREKVAIIVPYRQRASQLVTFLRHMHPFLINQNIDYRIFIVDQIDHLPFNRAALLNIGFIETQNFNEYDCFVFTDIDLLPLNQQHTYNCQHSPEHLSKNIDVLHYHYLRLPYSSLVGGAVAINKHHFKLVNGFSNFFWGWGGEDDDFSFRITYNNLTIYRKDDEIARYKMNQHEHTRINSPKNKNRYRLLDKSEKLLLSTGVNNIKYNITKITISLLFTSIEVDLTSCYDDFMNIINTIL